MAMSTTTLDKAIRYYKAGHSVRETADYLGVHETTIYRQFYRFGVLEQDDTIKEQHKAKLSQSQKKELIKRYNKGESSADLAEDYGISKNSLYYLVNKYSKPKQRVDEKAVDKAIRMHMANQYSIPEILKLTGVKRSTFYRKLKKYMKER